MASVIELTFNGLPDVDDNISLSQNYFGTNLIETFKTLRQQNFQSTLQADVEQTIIKFDEAFRADYPFVLIGQIGQVPTIEITPTTWTLTVPRDNNLFDDFLNNTPNISVVVDNTPLVQLITVTDISYNEADSSPCSNVKLQITTNIDMNEVVVNSVVYEIDPVSTSFQVDVQRGIGLNILVKADANTSTELRSVISPSIFIPVVITTQTLNGVTATVNGIQENTQDLGLEFAIRLQGSADPLVYSSSNVFTGLLTDDYEFWIKDIYGCEKSVNQSITNNADSLSAPPFINVPLVNHIYFAKRNDLKLNNENTLSYETTEENNYFQFQHELSTSQNIHIQYQSSYEFNKVYLVQNGQVVQTNIPQKLTSNIGFEDIRDGEVFSYNGKLAVRYDGGNVYDNAGNITGSSSLFGEVLYDQREGELVKVDTFGTLNIEQIVITSDLGTFMLFDVNYTGLAQTQKITFIYNIEDFEIFEFIINTSSLNGCYQLVISADNEDFAELEKVKYISERINISDLNLSDYFTVNYWNLENNQIAWQSGIQGIINMPKLLDNTFQPKGQNEIFTTDTKTLLLDAQIDEKYEFALKPIPLNIAKQLSVITSNDQLDIDGITYVKEEEPEIEALKGSGLYQVTFILVKSEGFNNNSRAGINDLNISGINGLLENEQEGFVAL